MSEPKERPILFSGPMVRAILEGRKTQTRRIVKKEPPTVISNIRTPGEKVIVPEWWFSYCPYGQPGDRLWVREKTWFRKDDGLTTYADGSFRTHPTAIIGSKVFPDNISGWPDEAKSRGFKPVPSIHMLRWQSRITLEITGVRVERLIDISEADAAAEGLGFDSNLMGPWEGHATARDAFRSLWESINGPESWALNPFVWVLEFKRLEAAQ